jgi:hypothetical protein
MAGRAGVDLAIATAPASRPEGGRVRFGAVRYPGNLRANSITGSRLRPRRYSGERFVRPHCTGIVVKGIDCLNSAIE